MIEITEKPIDPNTIYNRLSTFGSGSLVVHFGIVKPVVEERRTKGIQFTQEGDLKREMEDLEAELRKKWDGIKDVLFIRRMGNLHIGDIILVAAISASGRESAFGACREAVEKFKKLKCIRKRELFEKF